MWIFLILIAVPIIEIGLFIELGGWVGLWPTLALVVGTAILGAALLRMQGFAAMARLQASIAEGGNPAGPMAHGVMILIAGLLMLTPGFFTDAIGFSLLIPPVRSALIAWIGPKMASRMVHVNAGHMHGRDPRYGQPNGAPRGPNATASDAPIEADYVELDDGPEDGDRENGSKRPSGWSRPPSD